MIWVCKQTTDSGGVDGWIPKVFHEDSDAQSISCREGKEFTCTSVSSL